MCSPCLCTLSASASIHPPIPTFGRFLLEILLNFLFLLFFVTWCHPRPCSYCIIHAHEPTNGIQQLIHSAPTIEKRWSYVAVTLKTKRKSITPENSLSTGGCFECNTYHVTVLGWLKKKRNLIFNCFRFATLK